MKRFGQFRVGLEAPATTEEQLKIQSDIYAMRRAITYGRRDSSLIARCAQMAEMNGLSGEEAMVMLAYNALVELEGYWERCMQLAKLDINRPTVFTGETPKP